MRLTILAMVIAAIPTQVSWATEYTGRAMTGAFVSKELVTNVADGLPNNDAAAASFRLYLNAAQIYDENLSATLDLRDKHDFFDKLNRERLVLDERNTVQLRQLSLKAPNDYTLDFGGAFWSLGRFPVLDAGGAYNDGAEMGWRWSSAISTALFAGLNPKRQEQTSVRFNRDSTIGGGYFLYQPRMKDWTSSAYLSNAIVANRTNSNLDRLYWYYNGTYQPNTANRLTSLLYLDFVPSARVQQGFLNYSGDFGDEWGTSLGGSVVDVIEYTRRQGPLERLAASPYREGEAHGIYRYSRASFLDVATIHGKRADDGLWSHEYGATLRTSQIFMPELGASAGVAFRRQFVSDDYVLRLGLGYYSRRWEITLDETAAYQRYDSGSHLLPIFTQLALSHYFSRSFHGTISAEHAHDSQANIVSGFLSLGYSFGSRALSPIRNAAPLRGY